MPYGLPEEVGGDSKENEQWMERCVERVMKQGKDKSSAVAICKSTLVKSKKNNSDASFDLSLILYKLSN